jgi:two-component system, NtrC family, nitrogen regulation sensor histidine kinase NtrY
MSGLWADGMAPWWVAAMGVVAGVLAGLYAGGALRRSQASAERRKAVTVSDSQPVPLCAVQPEELSRGIDMLFELNPDAIVVYSELGVIMAANPAARDLFFDGVDPRGKNFLRLLQQAKPELRAQLLEDGDRLFSIEVDHQHETYHLTRKECELAQVPHTLLVVKHMTREVRRREVETLERSIRIISHEVNNSLAPIASLVHSARLIAGRPEHAQKLDKVLDTIEERADHLKGFLQGYAGLARLPKPKKLEVDFAPLLEHLRGLYPEVVLPAAPEGKGWFDPTQIQQLLINLLKNAIEAGSAPGDIEVVVGREADGTTRIEVLDRGQGLSEEALGQAILPLYTTKASGSGMGLALCREIVEAHGGEIALRNREGGGAAVRVTLLGKKPVDPSLSRSRARLTLSRP